MKHSFINLLKILLIFILIIGLYNFSHSLAPKRNQVQKVYDDFAIELDKQALILSGQRTRAEPTNEILVPLQASIEFVLRESSATKIFKYDLNWDDSVKLKKALRILDLLRLANAFSLYNNNETDKTEITIRVIGSSGYKFESFLSAKELQENSPLALALVLMREMQ